jgi:hypothetical protein
LLFKHTYPQQHTIPGNPNLFALPKIKHRRGFATGKAYEIPFPQKQDSKKTILQSKLSSCWKKKTEQQHQPNKKNYQN